MKTDSMDMVPGQYPPMLATSREQVLAEFDKNVANARVALEGATDENLMKPWTLSVSGKRSKNAAGSTCIQPSSSTSSGS